MPEDACGASSSRYVALLAGESSGQQVQYVRQV